MERGEIYVVDLGPGVDREASGVRPVVILTSDVYLAGPMFVVVVPAVESTDINAVIGIPIPAVESGFTTDLSVLARQPRTLDPSRFSEHPSGVVPPALLNVIVGKLKGSID